MNQAAIGAFIAEKRKEKCLTQAQLAQKLNVSNKTVSKWETGKCMPDYSIIQALCAELDITVSELMNAKEKENEKNYDEKQLLDLLQRTQFLESQQNILYGILFIVMGAGIFAISQTLSGSSAKETFSVVLLTVSVAAMLFGVFTVSKNLFKKK